LPEIPTWALNRSRPEGEAAVRPCKEAAHDHATLWSLYSCPRRLRWRPSISVTMNGVDMQIRPAIPAAIAKSSCQAMKSLSLSDNGSPLGSDSL
jgi:hypothetical protein